MRPCQAPLFPNLPDWAHVLFTGHALPRSLPVPFACLLLPRGLPRPLWSQVPLVRSCAALWHPDPLASMVEILYISLRGETHLILLVSLFSPLSWAWRNVSKSCPSFGPLSIPASYKTMCCYQLTGWRRTAELPQTLWSEQFSDQHLVFWPSGLSNR